MQPRVVQWVDMGGRKHHLVGGRLARAVANPTWNPIAKPGALRDYFKGNPEGRNPAEMLRDREPLPDHYMNPQARLKVMDAQGLRAVWLFPTLGVLYEELLRHDVDAVVAMMGAFNRWLEDDWGYNSSDRIFGAPYIALGDPGAAADEVERVLELGARIVVMRPAAVTTRTGQLSPFHETFDPVWQILNDAGVTVVIHAADSGYSSQGYADDEFSSASLGVGAGGGPNLRAFAIERAAQDWLMQSVFEKVYDRFPNLRVASVENGSDFLAPMFRKFSQVAKKNYWWFDDHPIDTFKAHVWVNPFWEDDVNEVTELMGADRVIFGSDWPHIEGMPEPLDYLAELKGFSDADRRAIMLDNVSYLNEPQPT
ncbi:MAG: amidohydrolase family protein [Acidimicrobiaceae bacterium]|nr:amidohydrolase family protein [Acidimicrobiaceae bacterium]MYL03897.1 amidohydrolase family protein [Acidimicrobiaceae bacterium]